jgi:hypothetical protein
MVWAAMLTTDNIFLNFCSICRDYSIVDLPLGRIYLRYREHQFNMATLKKVPVIVDTTLSKEYKYTQEISQMVSSLLLVM